MTFHDLPWSFHDQAQKCQVLSNPITNKLLLPSTSNAWSYRLQVWVEFLTVEFIKKNITPFQIIDVLHIKSGKTEKVKGTKIKNQYNTK